MDKKMKRNYIPYLRISFLMLLIYHIGSVEAEIVKKGLVSYWSFNRPTIKTKVQDLAGKNSGRIEGNKKIVKGLSKKPWSLMAKKVMLTLALLLRRTCLLQAVRNGRLPYG